MNNIQVFTNQHFGQVRIVMRDGDPWFVATDVCRALDVINSRHALTRLDEDVKGVVLNDTLGGKQSMAVVSEPGLYALVLGSRKPEAQSFRRWITHEVLPAIRQEGAYMTPERLHKVLEDPDTLIALAQRLKLLQEKNRALVDENEACQSPASHESSTVCKGERSRDRMNSKINLGEFAVVHYVSLDYPLNF